MVTRDKITAYNNSAGASIEAPADRFHNSAPSRPTATQTSAFCTKCGARLKNNPVGYIKSHK